MGWSIGGPDERGRFVGYGVPAYCDHPDCNKKIDRGLSYVCGGEPFGGERGCGLYFCAEHLATYDHAKVYDRDDEEWRSPELCERCAQSGEPFACKPEHPEWLQHISFDESWGRWRQENPVTAAKYRAEIVGRSSGEAP